MPVAGKRPVYPKFTTPKLVLKWPSLHKPSYGSKEHPKPDGEYVTKAIARMDDPAIQAMLAKLKPYYDEAMDEADRQFKELKAETRKKLGKVTQNALYTELLDQETEEPTGEIEFKFARRYSGVYKNGPKAGQTWTAKLPVFDAKNREMKIVPEIWGGSVAVIGFEAAPYFIPATGAAGLKLGLQGVQIIERVASGGVSAKSLGFEAQDDGYEYEEPESFRDDVRAEQIIGADDGDF